MRFFCSSVLSRRLPAVVLTLLVSLHASRDLKGAEPAAEAPRVADPAIVSIPPDRVLVQLHEGLPTHKRWPTEDEGEPAESLRWHTDHLLLSRIPLRYDDWGIRDAWDAPVLLRIAADVEIPRGQHRFLVRARGLGRLWVDGQLVAETDPVVHQPPNGEEPITPVTEPPLPGHRPAGYHQREVTGEWRRPDVATDRASESGQPSPVRPSPVRVVLECVVGGKGQRTESGEVLVAMSSPDGSSLDLLGPGLVRLPLTDAAVDPVIRRTEATLSEFDDRRRREAAASQDPYWDRRHEEARRWAMSEGFDGADRPGPAKTGVDSFIDAFILAKLDAARAATGNDDPATSEATNPAESTNPAEATPAADATGTADEPIAADEPATTDTPLGSDAEHAKADHFRDHVWPLFRDRCAGCHGEKSQGGLKLDSLEAVLSGGDSGVASVVPGDPDASELVERIRSDSDGYRMPPTGDPMTEPEIAAVVSWVADGAVWPGTMSADSELAVAPLVDDASFLRRVYLDTVGVPPTRAEAEAFLRGAADEDDAGVRDELIRSLLDDDRFADHWISFWLDLLAENPTLLNASLNSTGPFRWFLHDALRDRKPLDRMVTELILMRGDAAAGGSAGFGLAGENDSPMAAKGHIVASAFLGIELQCARCHDSPYHSTTQGDLYALAAMLDRKPVTVPPTSRVPDAFFEENEGRESLIRATLKPDESVTPRWPFAAATGIDDGDEVDALVRDPGDSRERLAALITAPQNERFARVIANRVWKRLVGAGLVEPVGDWEGAGEEGKRASHPGLLDRLARELVTSGYDFRHLVGAILRSHTYQREATGNNVGDSPAGRYFAAPDRRRLSAEQIVDSIHAAVGEPIDVEELTFVHDGRRPLASRQTLGRPSRAWMFGDLKNERDRPSLSLPRARHVVDVLEAFGWNGARQMPISERETDPNVLQPGILANGTMTANLTRAAVDSDLARLAREADSARRLVDALFLRTLTRYPTDDERQAFVAALDEGFETRLVAAEEIEWPTPPAELPQVTWFNHLRPRANEIQQALERRVRRGPPPDPRLDPNWREVYEDAVWSLINHREFVWIP